MTVMEQVILSGIKPEDLIEKISLRVAQIISQQSTNGVAESPGEYVTVRQAANLLHVTTRTVQSHLRKGKIKFKRLGRRILIKKEDLERSLK